ncbi:hypothetical protein [Maribacter sp. Asnod2-G09]|uniref:hypothetical protein n=1 Tax=Maribacter sp. Asnod2-G09 TaxID=3160577 RepID=UPI00386495CC
MEITKSDIIKLIEVEQVDTFGTHLLNIMKWNLGPAGMVSSREIKVWRQNSWNQMFYPIFKFELDKNGHLINISDKINPAGKIIYFLFCVIFSIPWLSWVFNDFDPIIHWVEILGWVIFLGIFLLVGFKIYQMEKKIQLEQIYEILDMESENNNPEEEWSWKKILTRLIMYPLCVFLIAITFFFLMPTGKIIYMLLTLGIVGVYLYTDLKILLRKKTTGNNT